MANIHMRWAAALAILALGGCGKAGERAPESAPSTQPLPPELPAPAASGSRTPEPGVTRPSVEPAEAECGADKLHEYLNLLPTSDAMAKIRAAVGERPIRTINPGDAVTMDFAPARLNLELGVDGRIKRFRCG
jgi:hypothetical protein